MSEGDTVFKKLDRAKIEASLEGVTRQYLAGHLSRPQSLEHFDTTNLEIGITAYKDFTAEKPHQHSKAVEYQYMLSGWTKYLDVNSGQEYEFKAGDFYAIYPGTAYAQKSKPGTRILFIKVPSINDKELVNVTDDIVAWLDDKLRTIRTDYFYDQNAPEPNSIRPAAAVAIECDGKILMVQRGDSGKWTLPGGTLDFGESLPECAIREMREETGLQVELKEVVGTYTDANIRIAYSDGEVRQEFTVVYFGTAADDDVVLDWESTAYRWVSLSDLKDLPMADSQRRRIDDLLRYLHTGEKTIG